jgi:hypothetical protein
MFKKLPEFNRTTDDIEGLTNEIEIAESKQLDPGFVSDMAANLGRKMPFVKEDTDLEEGRKLVGSYSHTNGHTSKVYKLSGEDHEGDDFHVKLFKGGKHYEPADYFTNDSDDAHSTAKHMVKEGAELSEIFANMGSGSTGTSREDKRIAKRRAEWNKQQAEKRAKEQKQKSELSESGYDDTMDPEDMPQFRQTAGEKRLGEKRKKENAALAARKEVTRTVTRSGGKDYSDSDESEPAAKPSAPTTGKGLASAPSWLVPKIVKPAGGKKVEQGITTKKEVNSEKLATHHQALVDRINRSPKKARADLMKRLPAQYHGLIKEDEVLDEGYHAAGTVNGKPWSVSYKDYPDHASLTKANQHLSKHEVSAVMNHIDDHSDDDFSNTSSVQNGHKVRVTHNGGFHGENTVLDEERESRSEFTANSQLSNRSAPAAKPLPNKQLGMDHKEKTFNIVDKASGMIKKKFASMKDAVAHHIGMGELKGQHKVVFAEDIEINPIDWFRIEVVCEDETTVMTIAAFEALCEGSDEAMYPSLKKPGYVKAADFFKMPKDQKVAHLKKFGKSDEEAETLTASPKKGKR